MRKGFGGVWPSCDPPDFGRFTPAHAGFGCARPRRPCSPKTSLIAHAKHGFTDGTVKNLVSILLLLYSRRAAGEFVLCSTPPLEFCAGTLYTCHEMLRAIRKDDGETVEAWSQKESSGLFACPSCGGEVILRGGRRRLDHFAHVAERKCLHDLGESENHRRCKAELWVCLADAPHVSDVQLERPLGEVRADVSANINGVPVAIEIQLSNLSVDDIIRRTKEYTRRGIYVLWLARWKPALDSGRYTPKPWERWLHAAYFGRV